MTALQSFHDSVKRGDLSAVREALDRDPALLDTPNEAGQSALLLAKYYRQEETADYLLSRNPKLDLFLACAAGRTAVVMAEMDNDPSLLEARSGDGWTPLHLAAFFGHDDLVTALLDRGASIEARSTNAMKNTPLHAASAGRHLSTIRLLLDRGANSNATQEGGWTALHAAAQNGDRATAELLLAHGADIEARAGNNQCALDLALTKGHHELAKFLDALGASR
ncbi:MAG TPA: ankyrin repeat domain-containing protein [Bryobacteraceae bacterium]|jgi:ankyrin repeat protein|nr:ankyrin repeat domain-containing protein [Bryobacteraceae bacterium]